MGDAVQEMQVCGLSRKSVCFQGLQDYVYRAEVKHPRSTGPRDKEHIPVRRQPRTKTAWWDVPMALESCRSQKTETALDNQKQP